MSSGCIGRVVVVRTTVDSFCQITYLNLKLSKRLNYCVQNICRGGSNSSNNWGLGAVMGKGETKCPIGSLDLMSDAECIVESCSAMLMAFSLQLRIQSCQKSTENFVVPRLFVKIRESKGC